MNQFFKENSIAVSLWVRDGMDRAELCKAFEMVKGAEFCVLSIGAEFKTATVHVPANKWAALAALTIEEEGWTGYDMETVAELLREGAAIKRTPAEEKRFKEKFDDDMPDVDLFLVKRVIEIGEDAETGAENKTQENTPEMV